VGEENMRTIGLLGGMSWESTTEYYRIINRGISEKLGGLHSAQITLYSIDFAPLERLQHEGDWQGVAEVLIDAALKVQAAGADFLLICTNTMHKVADQIEAALQIPLLHIADATAEVLVAEGVKKVGLLGTAFTMEEDFYRGRLKRNFELEIVTPSAADREIVHNVIYQELCAGKTSDASKTEYLRIIEELAKDGAEAVILGCTEIGLLVYKNDSTTKLYDTTVIHALAAIEESLK
jgi:aspartate racemase